MRCPEPLGWQRPKIINLETLAGIDTEKLLAHPHLPFVRVPTAASSGSRDSHQPTGLGFGASCDRGPGILHRGALRKLALALLVSVGFFCYLRNALEAREPLPSFRQAGHDGRPSSEHSVGPGQAQRFPPFRQGCVGLHGRQRFGRCPESVSHRSCWLEARREISGIWLASMEGLASNHDSLSCSHSLEIWLGSMSGKPI